MILSLRQRHRRVFAGLGIFLPVAVVIGITARPSLPIAKELSPVFAANNEARLVVWERSDLFSKAPISVQFLQPSNKSGGSFVGFTAAKNFVKPDLLVYWVPEDSVISDSLPATAILLGSFEASALAVNDSSAKSSGKLILFSLADSEIVDVSKPIVLNPSTH
jgi:hypothetical protein